MAPFLTSFLMSKLDKCYKEDSILCQINFRYIHYCVYFISHLQDKSTHSVTNWCLIDYDHTCPKYIMATFAFAKLIRFLNKSTLKPDRIFLSFIARVLYIKSHWYSPSLWSLNLIFVCNFLCNRNLSSMKWYIHGFEYLQKYLTARWW